MSSDPGTLPPRRARRGDGRRAAPLTAMLNRCERAAESAPQSAPRPLAADLSRSLPPGGLHDALPGQRRPHRRRSPATALPASALLPCLRAARPFLAPRGRPSAQRSSGSRTLPAPLPAAAAPPHQRQPAGGRATPGPAPCPGQALPLMSGRAGPRWRLLPARHGTARAGRRAGRGFRCALPAPPRWKEAVPSGTLPLSYRFFFL